MKQKVYLLLSVIYALSLAANGHNTYHGGYAIAYTNDTAHVGEQIGQILKERTLNAINKQGTAYTQVSREIELKEFCVFLGNPSNPQIPIICQYDQQTNRWTQTCGIKSLAFKNLKETDVPLEVSGQIVNLLQEKQLLTDYINNMHLMFDPLAQGDRYAKTHFAEQCRQEAAIFLANQNPQRLHLFFLRLATFLDRGHLARLFSTINPRLTQKEALQAWGIAQKE
jgi:hypothetical protein